ncbi:type II toxin-antitoxin system Phd/YefM family antitoxin [Salinibacterium sp. M195]|uniref:type II toxin-antitoxin system Phd/YefM family antitoxin n=1 Tax=Salinibacterium sp. M195 TaxID=2583374 RepID=UPI001C627541|nr:type II toxin-antitoxin system prevent-host-death family antitoxin [Salinibacterium sp. M195]QYH34732.1 type II toxin-antitoxin system prevent-host-death family antitoxin [Salinibacterium sp. M195]
MRLVNILEARNTLSRLVAAVGDGDEVVIAKRGKPVARLVPAIESVSEHTAARAAEWLTRNPVPSLPARTADELDRQIAAEREGWE